MPKPRSISACIAEIRRINGQFRSLKNKNGRVADILITEKDRLIDEMAAQCEHPEVLATRGKKSGRRICAKCGCSEMNPYTILVDRPTTDLPLDAYLLREGLLLKKLGINL